MNDPDRLLVDLRALMQDGALAVGDLQGCPTDRLRSLIEIMQKLLPLAAERVKRDDEAELAEARQRVAEIEARMGVLPNPLRPPSKPVPAPESDYDQTDAGMGIGGRAEMVDGQTAADFQDELAELRQAGAAKRRRRNA